MNVNFKLKVHPTVVTSSWIRYQAFRRAGTAHVLGPVPWSSWSYSVASSSDTSVELEDSYDSASTSPTDGGNQRAASG